MPTTYCLASAAGSAVSAAASEEAASSVVSEAVSLEAVSVVVVVAGVEAQAARLYFRALAPDPDFIRDREGPWPNAALNYGYGVLRAAVARALVGSGLTCFRGIHHQRILLGG